MYKLIKIFLILTLFTTSYASFAQNKQQSSLAENNINIEKIVVEGNKRVEKETIISYLPIKVGTPYSRKKEDEAVKTLYGTGLFSDVQISYKKNSVTIKVVENPVIDRIIFEGNNAIKSENLENELILRPRMVYSKSRVRDDTNKILEIYSKTGRYNASVSPKIVKKKHNRVDLVFDITEGKKAKIAKIFFIGNTHFSDRELKEVIMSKEAKFWNFFANTDHYDSDLVMNDRILLSRFYNSKGYANFKVVSAVADIEPSKNSFYLTFTLDEGHKFNFGKIDLISKIKGVNLKKLKSLIETKQGNLFNIMQVDNSIELITRDLANQGYPFVQIKPDYKENSASKIIDVTYIIEKSRRTYIGKIDIKGNLKTYDYVIRRQVKVSEGDPYNSFLIERSKRKLDGLDYFENVTIDTKKTNKNDVVDLDVNVTEKSTAQIKFSAGYSTADGILGMINFTENNFLGKGQYLNAGIQKSSASFSMNFGFTEPQFMGNDMSAGFNVFKSSYDNTSSSMGARSNTIPYTTNSYGLGLNMGYDIFEDLFHGVSYLIQRDNISKINKDAPVYIKQQAGSYTTSAIGQRFLYDKTDSHNFPTKGHVISLNQSLAGLGGNTRYIRNILTASQYFPIAEEMTFKISGSAAAINGFGGKDVRMNDRFFLGDQNFRGFQAAGIGPRDKASGDALGGQYYYTGTTEMTFPLGLPKSLEITGAVFAEAGSLWKVDIPKKIAYTKEQYYHGNPIRASAGFGILWITRMGPLRLDIAKAIKKEKYDKTQMLHFSFETRL